METDTTPPENGPETRWERLRASRTWRWGKEIALLLLIVGVVGAWQTRHHIAGGEDAPTFALRTLDGERVSTEGLKGKPTVLVFWAPWCTVCGAESSTISWVRDAYKDRIHLYSVALAYKDREDVQGFIKKHGVDYPVLLGHRGITRDWKVEAFPTLYILDSQGRIAHSTTGYTTMAGLFFRLLLTS